MRPPCHCSTPIPVRVLGEYYDCRQCGNPITPDAAPTASRSPASATRADNVLSLATLEDAYEHHAPYSDTEAQLLATAVHYARLAARGSVGASSLGDTPRLIQEAQDSLWRVRLFVDEAIAVADGAPLTLQPGHIAAEVEIIRDRLHDLAASRGIAARGPETGDAVSGDARDAARWRFVREHLDVEDNRHGSEGVYAIEESSSLWRATELRGANQTVEELVDDAIKRTQRSGHADREVPQPDTKS